MPETGEASYESPPPESEEVIPVDDTQEGESAGSAVSPSPPGSSVSFSGSPRLAKAVGVHLAMAALAGLLTILFLQTFRGHELHWRTHGPFSFDCGVYRSYAEGRIDISTTEDNKLGKHLLCAVLYPVFYRSLTGIFSVNDGSLVCAALGGLTLLGFGAWAYRRTQQAALVFPAMLLLGLSFNTWYVSSVWESRVFIMFGAMVLLIAIDRLLLRPNVWSLIFVILASIFSILITMGNAYLLPLVPFSLLLRVGRLGCQRVLRWSLFYLLAVGAVAGGTYQMMGSQVNPQLKIGGLAKISEHDTRTLGASFGRLTGLNYRNVGLQALVYSVGGLYLPVGAKMCEREWMHKNAWRAYFYYPQGIFFVAGYAILILLTISVFLAKKLWIREPVLWVILLWAFIYITFFVYFNPNAGPVYAAELQPPLWAFFVITLSRFRSKKVPLILLGFALILFWNNLSVVRYFRYYYGTERDKAALSRSFLPVPSAPVYRPGGI